jgi:hypothetical protein
MKRPALLRGSEEGGKATDRVFRGCKLLTGIVTRRNWSATEAIVWPLRDTSAAIFTPSSTSMAEPPVPLPGVLALADVFHGNVRDRVQMHASHIVDLKFMSNKGSATTPAR